MTRPARLQVGHLIRLTAAALTALSAFACTDRSEQTAGPATGQPNLSAAQAQSALDQVIAIQNRHTAELMALPGVVGTATGLSAAGRPEVLVFTRGLGVAGIPSTLEGAVVETRVTGDLTALFPDQTAEVGGGRNTKLTNRIRPVPNGVSVSNNNECAAGTLGAAVLINGAKYALSNNHVFARENAAGLGEPIVQPGRYDNKPKCANHVATDEIGTLADFEPIVFSGTANNVIDAAVAVATTDLTCSTTAAYYGSPSATTDTASLGLAVQKVGRTTGLTTGSIVGINATVTVGYPNGVARFVNQMVTSRRFSKAGDSGSLIVTNDGTNRPVGLLFAGSSDGTTIGNPIGPVLQRFGAGICSL